MQFPIDEKMKDKKPEPTKIDPSKAGGEVFVFDYYFDDPIEHLQESLDKLFENGYDIVDSSTFQSYETSKVRIKTRFIMRKKK